MENRKYEILRDDSKTIDGIKVYRIRALKKFGIVSKGVLGGYIEKDTNLSQEGKCWIFKNSIVYGDSVIMDNALIYDSRVNSIVVNNYNILLNNKIYGEGTDLYDSITNLIELYTQCIDVLDEALDTANYSHYVNPAIVPNNFIKNNPYLNGTIDLSKFR